MTAMPTQTESHLQEIAEKIETIKNLQQVPAGTIPPNDIQTITEELQAIGEVVFLLPESFTDKYSDVPWNEMKNWASFNTLVSGVTSEQLTNIICDLKKAEPEIIRHISPDRDIQNGIIALREKYLDQLYNDFYGRAESLTIIISLTAILVVIRVAILNVGVLLSGWQILVYSLIAIPVAWVAWDIVKEYEKPWVYNDTSTIYNTYTQFFDMSCDSLNENIYNISKLLDKRIRNRRWQRNIWMLTSGVSILVTIIIYFTSDNM